MWMMSFGYGLGYMMIIDVQGNVMMLMFDVK